MDKKIRPKKKCAILAAVVLPGILLAACSPGRTMAIWAAPKKTATPQSAEAQRANKEFWEVFHDGRYDSIPKALEKLTGEYLKNPGDAETAAHIGWLHIWRLSERARVESLSPSITDDLMLATRYFREAVALVPQEARYAGFLAGAMMSEGNVHKDEKLRRSGYYAMRDAVKAWPEFNLFTAGYVMSNLSHTDAKYQEAVDFQWETLDKCAEKDVDRRTADFSDYMGQATAQGKKRVCWNSWIVPHNFEGFFLNMGDMIVKQGDPATAKQVYAQAKLSKTYDTWKYREFLERRIVAADANVHRFRKPPEWPGNPDTQMMINTRFACMACHQE